MGLPDLSLPANKGCPHRVPHIGPGQADLYNYALSLPFLLGLPPSPHSSPALPQVPSWPEPCVLLGHKTQAAGEAPSPQLGPARWGGSQGLGRLQMG